MLYPIYIDDQSLAVGLENGLIVKPDVVVGYFIDLVQSTNLMPYLFSSM